MGGSEMKPVEQAPQRPLANARTVDTAPTDQDAPTYRATSYTVYPTGFDRIAVPERDRWRIQVVDAGDGWAVRWRSRCLSYRRIWEFEPPRAGRSDDFLHRCRFSERSALLRAKQAIDDLIVDGMTYDEFVQHICDDALAKAKSVLASGQGAALGQARPGAPTLPLHNRLLQAFR
jgi:hypothetical protein